MKRNFGQEAKKKKSWRPAYAFFIENNINQYSLEMQAEIEPAFTWNDPEKIHRLRVASRRLAAAVSLLPRNRREALFDSLGEGVKNITGGLSRIRDIDVQEKYLCEMRGKTNDQKIKSGLVSISQKLKKKFSKLQKDAEQLMAAFTSSHLLAQAIKRTNQTDRQQAAQQKNIFLQDKAERVVQKDSRGFMAKERLLTDLEDKHAIHRMRILAKKFRYRLEVMYGLLGDASARKLETIRQIQMELGEIHDCDIWVEYLSRMKEKTCATKETRQDKFHREENLAPSILWLHKKIARRRQVLAHKFEKTWQSRAAQLSS